VRLLHTQFSASSILAITTNFIGEPVMASVKKGTMTRSPQWWKHLKEWKRVFWKAERQAHKKAGIAQLVEQ